MKKNETNDGTNGTIEDAKHMNLFFLHFLLTIDLIQSLPGNEHSQTIFFSWTKVDSEQSKLHQTVVIQWFLSTTQTNKRYAQMQNV